MTAKDLIVISLVIAAALGCSNEERRSASAPKPEPTVIIRPKPKTMTAEQKAELGFPQDLIETAERAANAEAEPFFEHIMISTANLKGDVKITSGRLSGFSVHTQNADQVIDELSPSFRRRGYLVFRSEQNFGPVPDVVTVVRGNSSYDILNMQKTESSTYHLDTRTIITWLKAQQKLGAFVITGAGADWVEARFISPPGDMRTFARRVAAFAPDALAEQGGSIDRLVQRMERTNGFSLWWD